MLKTNEIITFMSHHLFLLLWKNGTIQWFRTFFKLNKIWIRLNKYSLWVTLKCSHCKTFFEMLKYLPLLAWKWPMRHEMQHEMSADISFHFGNHFAPGQSKQYSIDCLHQKVESPPQLCKIKRSWFSPFFRFFKRDLYQMIF